jgi:CubicO group peptidase (beta-lactamase class C family)
VVPLAPDSTEGMGLGFFTMNAAGTTLIGHTGEQAGFRSWIYFNPASRAGVIACVNTTDEARPEDSERAFRAALRAATATLH